ncbi:MAG: flagellar motor switch protein FliN [Thermoleophilia bacterium]|jgi:flagellar motor switch protein FliN/FliY|nr:flagellar motor switch protein FliN [Thermoleophilia bacterium]
MSDWLSQGDADGYLGLDDPAMPDSAPAPPSAPMATQAADSWASGGDLGGDWLGGDATAAPQQGHQAGAPVMDSQGDWFGDSTGAAPAVTPGAPAPQGDYYGQQQTAAPMAMSMNGGVSVTAPSLEHVQPSRRPMGGSTGELSNLVLDVEVQVEVGLGNAALTVEEFLEMGRGSIVELDTPVDAPIELTVRGKLIARGQLVSINGSYGMRIVEMLNEEN